MSFSLTKLGGILLGLSLAAKPFIPAKALAVVQTAQGIATTVLPADAQSDAAGTAQALDQILGGVGSALTIIGVRNALAKNGKGQ